MFSLKAWKALLRQRGTLVPHPLTEVLQQTESCSISQSSPHTRGSLYHALSQAPSWPGTHECAHCSTPPSSSLTSLYPSSIKWIRQATPLCPRLFSSMRSNPFQKDWLFSPFCSLALCFRVRPCTSTAYLAAWLQPCPVSPPSQAYLPALLPANSFLQTPCWSMPPT